MAGPLGLTSVPKAPWAWAHLTPVSQRSLLSSEKCARTRVSISTSPNGRLPMSSAVCPGGRFEPVGDAGSRIRSVTQELVQAANGASPDPTRVWAVADYSLKALFGDTRRGSRALEVGSSSRTMDHSWLSVSDRRLPLRAGIAAARVGRSGSDLARHTIAGLWPESSLAADTTRWSRCRQGRA